MMYFGAKFKRSEVVRVVCRASKSKCIKVSGKNDWTDDVLIVGRNKQFNIKHCLVLVQLFVAALDDEDSFCA
jgi:hypothetical protein